MGREFYLSIVIPAYKEELRIHKILDAIVVFEKKVPYKIETIVVLDGSPDKSLESTEMYKDKIKNLVIVDRNENKGKGYTVKEGVIKAKGEYILFSDADNSTPIEQVEKLLRYVDNFKVVIGSRYVYGGRLAEPQPFTRWFGGRVMNLFIRMLAVKGIADTQCGFKLFEHEAAKEIFKRMTFDRWSFDIEVLAIARRLRYKIKEAGITWYDDPHSQVSPIKDGLRMIKDSWVVRKNILAGKYK